MKKVKVLIGSFVVIFGLAIVACGGDSEKTAINPAVEAIEKEVSELQSISSEIEAKGGELDTALEALK